jgi:hypothetical protein
MRETITFPRPHHRPLRSVLALALIGGMLLVLGLPGPIAEQSGVRASHAGTMAVVAPQR